MYVVNDSIRSFAKNIHCELQHLERFSFVQLDGAKLNNMIRVILDGF